MLRDRSNMILSLGSTKRNGKTGTTSRHGLMMSKNATLLNSVLSTPTNVRNSTLGITDDLHYVPSSCASCSTALLAASAPLDTEGSLPASMPPTHTLRIKLPPSTRNLVGSILPHTSGSVTSSLAPFCNLETDAERCVSFSLIHILSSPSFLLSGMSLSFHLVSLESVAGLIRTTVRLGYKVPDIYIYIKGFCVAVPLVSFVPTSRRFLYIPIVKPTLFIPGCHLTRQKNPAAFLLQLFSFFLYVVSLLWLY